MAKWITKANDDLLSFCTCEHPLAATPGQLDCPWCGCGWLISCSFCRQAFTFGRVISVDRSGEDLVRADMIRGGYDPAEHDIVTGAAEMQRLLEPFEPGDLVVYLDGCYVGAREGLTLTGLYARHTFDLPPQTEALEERIPLSETLECVDYWLERERADRE